MKRAVGLALLVLFTACSAGSAQQARRPAPTDVVAIVGSASITLGEVDDKALQQPASRFGSVRLSQALYTARRAALDELIASRLFDDAAKAQGIDRTALVEKEITSKIQSVSDAEVEAWYNANRSRVQGATLDQARQPIRQYLTEERMQVIRDQYLEALKTRTPVRVMLEPPRQTVKMAASSPTRGPANAPIEMIEFSDFQ
jgi:hypothetical protein